MRSSPTPPLDSPHPAPSRERLLDAAAEVFARQGLSASTTREIAQAAGLNEVTLFRLFKNKNNLLAAVLDRIFSAPVEPQAAGKESNRPQECLTKIVQEYAESYTALLNRNLTLVRVLLGEIQHFQEHELKVIRGIFRPERQRLIERLLAAQERGLVRKDANPVIIADQVGGIVFTGTLRSALPLPQEYSATDYLAECVKTIVRGIEASPKMEGADSRKLSVRRDSR